jgi:hypothetical protein
MAERMSDRYIDHDRNGSSKYQFHTSSHFDTLAPMEIMEDGSAMDVSGMKGGSSIFTKYTPEELGMDVRGTPFERKDAESVAVPSVGGIIPIQADPANATFEQQGSEIAFQDGSVAGGPAQYEPGTVRSAEDRFASGRRLVSSVRDFVSSDVGMTLLGVCVLGGIYTLGRRSKGL